MNGILAIFGAFGLSALTCFADSPFADPRLSTPETIRLLTPEVMDFMKSADSVCVFHVDPSRKPNDVQLQEISGQEKSQLLFIFLDPANYYQGLYCIAEPPADFGIEFRKKDEKLTLICGGLLLDGNFRGRRVSGVLATSGNRLFTQWRQKYPQLK